MKEQSLSNDNGLKPWYAVLIGGLICSLPFMLCFLFGEVGTYWILTALFVLLGLIMMIAGYGMIE